MEFTREIKNPYRVLIEDVTKLLADVPEQQIKSVAEKHFREVIQSNRVVSYIKDICDLVAILEARNFLYSQNVDGLLLISESFQSSLAVQRVEAYKNYKPVVRISLNQIPKKPIKFPQTVKEELIEEAFQLVSSSIEIDWRKLARDELGVKNREIDKISTSTPDNQSAAAEMLKLFRQERSSQNQDQVVSELIAALRAISRVSLAESINKEIVLKSRRH